MENTVVASAVSLLFLLYLTSAQQERCGSIGYNDETAATPSRTQLFYLNTANPAPCTGNITSWRVCYYGPNNIDSAGSYWAIYAVYRRMGSGSNVSFVRVSEIFRAVRTISRFTGDPVVDGEIAQGGFNCYNDSLDSPLTIQVGDILGACVFNPNNIPFVVTRLQLDVVGVASGESLLQMGTADCSMEAIPSNIPANQLSTVSSRRLHIYANIKAEPTNIQTTSTPSTTVATVTVTATILTTRTVTDSSIGAPTTTLTVTTPLPTTLPPQTPINPTTESMSTTTDLSTTSDEEMTAPVPNISGGGLPPGPIVGIIIGVLLSLVLGVAIVVMVVLYLVRHMKAGGRYSTGKTAYEKNVYGIDNITYEVGDTRLSINGDGITSALEASPYEVPVNTLSMQNKWTEHEYHELSGSTYATPHTYEYATLGPNEAKPPNSENNYYSPLDEATISYARLLEKSIQEDIYGNVEEYLQPATGKSELHAQIKACGIKNIPSNLIQIKRRLGSGKFGFVEQGVWRNRTKDIPVALKLLKEGATETDKVKFLQEAAIMAQFTHPNVVSLYGVVSKTESLMLVVELIQKGDLRNYLYTMRPDPGELPAANILELLLSFSQQVALGMHYLSAKRFVHRDLAARNILVSKDNICKVADFGMSRNLSDENYYVSQGGQIPVKWTAPEAIHYKKYSTASDVWSYGCLLYEIWSLGYKPFEGVGNAKVIELVDSGQRLSPPPGCSRVIYELMIKCWNPVAAQRPSFRELLLTLLSNLKEVLSIPLEALDTHNLAGVLGSPLKAGENMYRDLQNRYCMEDDHDYQELG